MKREKVGKHDIRKKTDRCKTQKKKRTSRQHHEKAEKQPENTDRPCSLAIWSQFTLDDLGCLVKLAGKKENMIEFEEGWEKPGTLSIERSRTHRKAKQDFKKHRELTKKHRKLLDSVEKRMESRKNGWTVKRTLQESCLVSSGRKHDKKTKNGAEQHRKCWKSAANAKKHKKQGSKWRDWIHGGTKPPKHASLPKFSTNHLKNYGTQRKH